MPITRPPHDVHRLFPPLASGPLDPPRPTGHRPTCGSTSENEPGRAIFPIIPQNRAGPSSPTQTTSERTPLSDCIPSRMQRDRLIDVPAHKRLLNPTGIRHSPPPKTSITGPRGAARPGVPGGDSAPWPGWVGQVGRPRPGRGRGRTMQGSDQIATFLCSNTTLSSEPWYGLGLLN